MKEQKIVVAAVIHDKEKFLVIKRSGKEDFFPNKWELPSGKVEFGEQPDNALVREVKEETGLTATKFLPIKCTHYVIEKPEKKRHTVQIIYLTNVLNTGPVKLSEEHNDYRWIMVDELPLLDTFEDMPDILSEAQKKITSLR